ncbi:MazG nucleotide pyrophosphohydrolase domain-containing protein [Glaciecola petra]|uniref:MazG nucleotide pyrophosphohydrolase domain-containing protein n=1 Tax=Glaciecola petra TaxID=3075602 RepID=A0ABU2ZYC2_9ALTE|nr:MazG nucleotide pyrophosphohydrolase domain-containing protein [Aestuariibacter sp. P117]MDT0596584.1 MazG nucleotide pyrophosphohydrolase domain-containing protein [Aestuariibacter sp. P117]
MSELQKALTLQQNASAIGFDWKTLAPVIAKVLEEVDEVKEAINTRNAAAIEDEVGDLLFAVVNIARHLRLDPDDCLRQASEKFQKRLLIVKKLASEQQVQLKDLDEQGLDALWRMAKNL